MCEYACLIKYYMDHAVAVLYTFVGDAYSSELGFLCAKLQGISG